MYSDTNEERGVDRPVNVLARDQSGLSVSFDALSEELNTTADLVSNLFHKLDPVLFREGDDKASDPSRPTFGGSQVQETVWEKVSMVGRINAQLRDLTTRIDV